MEEKYVNVKGIKTRYLEAGTGEPVVLVHGGHFGSPYNANDWDLNIDSLAKFFHVYAIDKIGAGFTDNPKSDEEYLIGSSVQHVYDFLNTMQIDSAHMAGHSRGGYTVCRLALEHPERVTTLIIAASGTLFGSQNPTQNSSYDEWRRLAALIKDIRDRHRYMAAANSFGSEHITDDFVDVIVRIVTLPKSQEAVAKMKTLRLQFLGDLETKRKETHEWIRAGKLKAPTLITWGFNDPSASFAPVGLDGLRLILPSVPRSEMHIFNRAGHYHFREQPEAFVIAVTNFIKLNSEI
ncbi:alpha/beta fold hydrolase [Chloroflexota bacterium]